MYCCRCFSGSNTHKPQSNINTDWSGKGVGLLLFRVLDIQSQKTKQTSEHLTHTGVTHGQSSSLPAIPPGIPCFRSHRRCSVPVYHHEDGSNPNMPHRSKTHHRKHDTSNEARSGLQNEHPETSLLQSPSAFVLLNDWSGCFDSLLWKNNEKLSLID